MEPHSFAGHRDRLLSRFEKGGIDGFHDYEIVELLLTYAIPRRDTKALAKALLARFKSLNDLLHASPEELQKTPGIGRRAAYLLRLVREMAAVALRERYQNESVITKRKDVEEYLRFHFGARRDEYVAALFLDNGNHVLATDVLTEGTVNQCAVYPRIIVQKALSHGASSIILAHNHPGGSTQASEADWQITLRLHTVGRLLDIPLIDHVIVSRENVISLRESARWPQ
jgi:DNA repair protein RadC